MKKNVLKIDFSLAYIYFKNKSQKLYIRFRIITLAHYINSEPEN